MHGGSHIILFNLDKLIINRFVRLPNKEKTQFPMYTVCYLLQIINIAPWSSCDAGSQRWRCTYIVLMNLPKDGKCNHRIWRSDTGYQAMAFSIVTKYVKSSNRENLTHDSHKFGDERSRAKFENKLEKNRWLLIWARKSVKKNLFNIWIFIKVKFNTH